MGRREEALAEARAAWECDPLALIINAQLAQPLYYARRFEETIAEAERLVRMEPAFPITHQWLGMALAAVGRYDEAIRELQLLADAFPKAARPMALIANLQARAGEREAALRAREELRQAAASGQSRAMHVALVDIGLGATDQAFAWLEQAYAEHSDQLAYLAVEPFFDPLRGDPRFDRLLERLRLPRAVE